MRIYINPKFFERRNKMKNFKNHIDFSTKEELHFESKAVHGALGCEPLTGAVSMPIYQSATFRHPELGNSTGFDYSRLSNPTRLELERTMAILEGGVQGFAFSSGQAANMAVFSLLNVGDHVVMSDDIYGGTLRIINDVFGKYGIKHTCVDMGDLDAVRAAVTPETKML
jgi:cystathionine gamma-synthase